MTAVWACAAEGWSPKIGDPTVLGWFTVFAYAVATLLSLRLTFKPSRRVTGDFWLMLSILLFCLCINKQLDLQSAATSFLRCHAQIFDWYDLRRTVQLFTILLVGGLVAVLILTVGWSMRHKFSSHWQAIIGICLLLGFVAARAASFTHVDRLINLDIGFLKMDHVLELSGILLIILNAAILLRKISESHAKKRAGPQSRGRPTNSL